jgi:chromosome partitioning protein
MKTVALLNRKGGAGKTTTAIGLALGLVSLGLRVGLVDCDPNGSAARWLSGMDGLDMVPCAAGDLEALLQGLTNDYDIIVVDSPPNDEKAMRHIARSSDLVLLPVAPTPVEVDQLPDTVEVLAEIGAHWIVVPVRVRMSTTAGKTIRKQCADLGVPVTNSMIPLTEAIAGAFGQAPPRLSYAALVTEVNAMLTENPAA